MSRKSRNLIDARINKKDEFYTLYEDIEKEMQHYDFKDKVIVCPCNDADKNFHRYFTDNFEKLGLKRLICVHYNPDRWGGSFYYDNGEKKLLKGDGDFRSKEVIDLMKQGDYIITNPPFSLFTDFIRIINQYDFKFCVIGNINAVGYKDVFPLFKEDKLWLGHTMRGGGAHFEVPNEYYEKELLWMCSSWWYQNIEKYIPNYEFNKTYSPEAYPKYDDCDAIEVSRYKDIPKDYDGVMGVPISSIKAIDASVFDILDYGGYYLQGKKTYKRLLVKKKDPCGSFCNYVHSPVSISSRYVFSIVSLSFSVILKVGGSRPIKSK